LTGQPGSPPVPDTATTPGSPPTLDAASAAALLLEAAKDGRSAAATTVVGAPPWVPLGSRLTLVRTGSGSTRHGHLGDDALDRIAVGLMEAAIENPKARDGIRTIETSDAAYPKPAQQSDGDGLNQQDERAIELYLEIRRPIRDLIVVGAGHIAQPMAHVGALLGYRVTVLDDRPDFATRERFPDAHRLIRADFSDPFAEVSLHERSYLLLVTRGHKYDYECLVRALRADPPPAYIGMIGSRRRVRATYVQLIEEGVDRELIDRIHAPVGLDVGAETPEEIAVSVAAELVMLDRGGSGVPLKDVERVAERFFKP
jgi:xanthine/CO dehydrogenase XdhC/CoxF family maturation factor